MRSCDLSSVAPCRPTSSYLIAPEPSARPPPASRDVLPRRMTLCALAFFFFLATHTDARTPPTRGDDGYMCKRASPTPEECLCSTHVAHPVVWQSVRLVSASLLSDETWPFCSLRFASWVSLLDERGGWKGTLRDDGARGAGSWMFSFNKFSEERADW